MNLTDIFASLQRHTIARAGEALPPAQPGIEWIWAANRLFKRGCDATLDLLIPVAVFTALGDGASIDLATPGLANLVPHVRWAGRSTRIDGRILYPLLADARRQGEREKQYFVVADGPHGIRLIAPRAQIGEAGRVRYVVPPNETILVDIHSHHTLDPFFSPTDNRDDLGLSVSVVIGRIFDRPQITARLNVYGHRARVPVRLIFDTLGPFEEF